MANGKRLGGPTRKITLSMDDLNASLDSFLVGPPPVPVRGPVVAREDTAELNCTDGATCNFKCGPTAYWECGETSLEYGCDTLAGTCYSCGVSCQSCGAACETQVYSCPVYC